MGSFSSWWKRWRRPRVDDELPRSQLRSLERRLGYRFKDPQVLVHALKHRSYVYARQERGLDSNERLEYLGDAVLDLLVAEFLFRTYVSKREGELTEMKSQLVSRAVLAKRALDMDLGAFILLSPEEHRAGGGQQPSILSDAFEAVLGAIYLDGGLEAGRRFVENTVLVGFREVIDSEDFTNFKSKLLEHTQSLGHGHPKYLLQAEEGPDHCKLFSVEVVVTGEKVGDGQGRSKKEAQQMAAKAALQRLGAI
jgi:ribonuclease III